MKLIGLTGKEYMHAPINHIEDTYATWDLHMESLHSQAKNKNQMVPRIKAINCGPGKEKRYWLSDDDKL